MADVEKNWIDEMIERGKPEVFKILENVKGGKNILNDVNIKKVNDLLYLYITGVVNKEENGKFVYILKCNEFYKIGITDNIEKRLSSIRNGNPYKVTVLHSKRKQDAYNVEQSLHRLYRKVRVRGEWFQLEELMVKEIIDILENK